MSILKSQVIIMLRRILARINNNFDQVLAGVSIIAIGASLLLDRKYFFWPPELIRPMNDQRLDVCIIALGLLIFVNAFIDQYNRAWRMTILVAGLWLMWILALIQLGHAYYAGQIRMAHTIIGDIVVSILCLHSIYES